jgi:hypothetical protein
MKKLNVVLSFTFASLISIAPPAFAKGVDGGGGQKCQAVFESRRNDIADWIQAGADSVKNRTEPVGSALLNFKKSNTNLVNYDKKMLAEIALTKTGNDDQSAIGCTDNPKEVMVDGKYKTCKAFGTQDQPQILCYSGVLQNGQWTGGFMGSSDDDQYWQVHHEFAVLAGFEDQAGRNSDYELSDQLVGRSGYPGFVISETVRKLAIKPQPASVSTGPNSLQPASGKTEIEYGALMQAQGECYKEGLDAMLEPFLGINEFPGDQNDIDTQHAFVNVNASLTAENKTPLAQELIKAGATLAQVRLSFPFVLASSNGSSTHYQLDDAKFQLETWLFPGSYTLAAAKGFPYITYTPAGKVVYDPITHANLGTEILANNAVKTYFEASTPPSDPSSIPVQNKDGSESNFRFNGTQFFHCVESKL